MQTKPILYLLGNITKSQLFSSKEPPQKLIFLPINYIYLLFFHFTAFWDIYRSNANLLTGVHIRIIYSDINLTLPRHNMPCTCWEKHPNYNLHETISSVQTSFHFLLAYFQPTQKRLPKFTTDRFISTSPSKALIIKRTVQAAKAAAVYKEYHKWLRSFHLNSFSLPCLFLS